MTRRNTDQPRAASRPKLVVVLGDQLTPTVSSLVDSDRERDVVILAEVRDETTYVRHHKKKIAFVFAAMRHFAAELTRLGWRNVHYRQLDAGDDAMSLKDAVSRAIGLFDIGQVVVTAPGEWRLHVDMATWADSFGIPVEIRVDDRFLCSIDEFRDWARDRKQLRMEYFYRDMRRKTGLLMTGKDPVGGKWNFDHDNRKRATVDMFMPKPVRIEPDAITRNVLDLVAGRFSAHIGTLEPFTYAVTRADAERALEHFITGALARFGDFQDAMLEGEPYLYHSLLSAYINVGLLDPLTVCRRVEQAYRAGTVPLNAAEGFIRQIIGWREYVRGIYWLRMPDYIDENFFNHSRPVPECYWTADTDMACVRAAVSQTIEHAYAHHIQRLMITGNFALLTGTSPHALHEWYLMVYIDAFEWVELPNTLGMSQFGDGGLLASKPYVSSGAYIDRMSDHCKNCHYDVDQPTGPKSCPFNALYWSFLDRHRDKLSANPRMSQMYRTWDKMSDDKRDAVRRTSAATLAKLDAGERL